MKTFALTFAALFFTAFSLSPLSLYSQLFGLGSIQGSGKIVTDTRPVAAFSKIKSTSSGNVIFKQGDKRELIIEADDNIWEKVTTDVSENGELVLGLQNGSYNNIRLKFIITNPTLEGVHISGSGSVNVETPIESKQLTSTISGSGSLRYMDGKASKHSVSISGSGSVSAAKLQADEVSVFINGSGSAAVYSARTLNSTIPGSGSLDVDGMSDALQIVSEISGSGSIRFKNNGKAQKHDITIRGSGSVVAEKLQTNTVNVQISSSGDARIFATAVLEAQLDGSGSVYYDGEPSTINKTIRGSGRVRKR